MLTVLAYCRFDDFSSLLIDVVERANKRMLLDPILGYLVAVLGQGEDEGGTFSDWPYLVADGERSSAFELLVDAEVVQALNTT